MSDEANPIQVVQEGDSTGGLIPYKNPSALIAYYFAVFSLIPFLGLLGGIPAVILGIMGVRYRAKNPAAKGLAHAWVGIVLGGLTTLLWGGIIVAGVIAAATHR